MAHFKVIIKEVGSDHTIETEYVGPITRQGIIDFYGLKNPDVEWYRIEEVKSPNSGELKS